MKLILPSIMAATATAQLTPARLRNTQKRELRQEEAAAEEEQPDFAPVKVDSELWDTEEEFGRFYELTERELFTLDGSFSFSYSLSMAPTDAPTPDEAGPGMPSPFPTPAPFYDDLPTPVPTPFPTTFTDTPTTNSPTEYPTTETHRPTVITDPPTDVPTTMPFTVPPTSSPTFSKSGKETKRELFAYSWDLPAEYTGYFSIYKGEPKGRSGTVDDLELVDTVEMGTGTSGSDSVFLPRERYTIVAVNKNATVGYCCEGSEPGWLHFTYGGIEYDRKSGEYKQKKDRDEFVAEFHRNPKKVEVGDDGAFYEFTIKL